MREKKKYDALTHWFITQNFQHTLDGVGRDLRQQRALRELPVRRNVVILLLLLLPLASCNCRHIIRVITLVQHFSKKSIIHDYMYTCIDHGKSGTRFYGDILAKNMVFSVLKWVWHNTMYHKGVNSWLALYHRYIASIQKWNRVPSQQRLPIVFNNV